MTATMISCVYCSTPVPLVNGFRNDCPSCRAVARDIIHDACHAPTRVWSEKATREVIYDCTGCGHEARFTDMTVDADAISCQLCGDEGAGDITQSVLRCPTCHANGYRLTDIACGQVTRVWSKSFQETLTYACSCGRTVVASTPRAEHEAIIPPTTLSPPPLRVPSASKWARVALIALVALVGWGLKALADHSGSTGNQGAGAIQYCEKQVKAQLLSPSSASFGGIAVHGSGDTLRVDGYVDADNAFGAPIRKHWTCDSSGIVTIAR